MKRAIAILCAVLAVCLVFQSVQAIDDAKDWLQLFKALIWFILGSLAFMGFLEDYRENKWPFFG